MDLPAFERAIRDALARPGEDRAVLAGLEVLAQDRRFNGFTWLWGPELYRRNRVHFRPFVLQHFSRWLELPKKWEEIRWERHADVLGPWLAAADAADDAPLFVRLYAWKERGRIRPVKILADLLPRLRVANGSAARQLVLRKFEQYFELSEDDALALFTIDPRVTGPFILRRLPFGFFGAKRQLWRRLLQAADERGETEFRWQIYRAQVPKEEWERDLAEVAARVRDRSALDQELEQRHPRHWGFDPTDAFLRLLEQRSEDAFPYVSRHLDQVRRRFFGGGSWRKIVTLAQERGWRGLWGGLLRTAGSKRDWNEAVAACCEARGAQAVQPKAWLLALAGLGREWNFRGLSLGQVVELDARTAKLLHRTYPEMLRGPFRAHLPANAWDGSERIELIRHFHAAGEDELVDYFASRLVTRCGSGSWAEPMLRDAEHLSHLYEALRGDQALFTRRVARVLSQVPAYAIYAYRLLIRQNRLARLLFERSETSYLADPAAVADLVEASEIHVMALGYRVLGLADERARALAAQHLPLLLGTLLRPLHRSTRQLAFAALENAAVGPSEARRILQAARAAQRLPDTHYPKEALLGLIGRLLHRHPELARPTEQRVIHRRAA
ncbi:MAG: hypothetical protein JSR82_04875 [Verrucomicrobia bacterium]|nr:hypothetical protein [Verrucomicrobiota bacterium]